MYKNINIEKCLVAGLLLFSVAVRIIALFTVESIAHPNTWEYEQLANNFLEGKGLYYDYLNMRCRSTSMVLYSLICAWIYYLTSHSFLAVKLFQILISVFACFLTYKFSRRLFGGRVGIIALALISVHPGLVVYSIKLHPLTLDVLLFILSIFFFTSLLEREKIAANSILTGIFMGMALLTRATIGLFIPAVFLMILFRMRGDSGSPA